MKGQGTNLTRRKFLHLVGLAGGSAAVYETMVTLGLLRTPEAWAGPPKLPGGIGTGKSVVVRATSAGSRWKSGCGSPSKARSGSIRASRSTRT